MTNKTDESFEVKGEDAHAIGQPVEDGFVVRAGAYARKRVAPSASHYVERRRADLLANGVLIEEDGRLRFTKDYVFTSPSAAAATVLGGGVNGWMACRILATPSTLLSLWPEWTRVMEIRLIRRRGGSTTVRNGLVT